jgi:hypothetical protein
MDDVYEANTEPTQTRHRLLQVRDYVIQRLASMDYTGNFDRIDRINNLTWALEWYSGKQVIAQEKQVSLIIGDGNRF